jgi:lysophospholipase L1-like esterase
MIDSLRFSFWPVMVAAVLSAAPAHAQGDKYVPGAIEASAQKAVASAQTSASPQCSAPNELTRLERPLTRTARLLAAGLPIKIVAIGSSSTAGAGASSPAASYPSRLAAELTARFPNHEITVLNRGVNGEEARDMLSRFETTVIAERPDLVLWQVGTNTVLRDHPVAPTSSLIEKGIVQLKAAGADVILIDPQFAPRVIAKSALSRMIDLLHSKAKQYDVNLFQRFAVMRHWRERQGISFETFVSSDQLHMNDWSYACVAKVLSSAIVEAATRPVASAAARAAR